MRIVKIFLDVFYAFFRYCFVPTYISYLPKTGVSDSEIGVVGSFSKRFQWHGNVESTREIEFLFLTPATG